MRKFLLSLLFLIAVLSPQLVEARAITVTEKMSGGFGAATGSTSNTASYTTSDTFSLAANEIGICFVHNTDTGTAGDIADQPSLTHNSVAWTIITTQTYTANQTGRVSVFWKAGPQGNSAVTTDYSGDNQTGNSILCYAAAGADLTTPVIQAQEGTASGTTVHTLTMDDSLTANSVLFMAIGVQESETWTPEFVNVGTEATYSTPGTETLVQWDINGSDTTPLFSSGSNAVSGMVAVEIAQASGGGATTPKPGAGMIIMVR